MVINPLRRYLAQPRCSTANAPMPPCVACIQAPRSQTFSIPSTSHLLICTLHLKTHVHEYSRMLLILVADMSVRKILEVMKKVRLMHADDLALKCSSFDAGEIMVCCVIYIALFSKQHHIRAYAPQN
ncbi:hypothetical protein VPH35_090070 [Triticum aestivum]|uniref:Uncharacterized protein n=1 Tax=Triticum turgidum subsp. durum TaxID=4567 RepID=A0A9R0X8N4_TRITD|nr:unnamed protein product [Triticum turgidum subsp. durum]